MGCSEQMLKEQVHSETPVEPSVPASDEMKNKPVDK